MVIPEHFVALLGQDLGQLFDVADELGVADELVDRPEEPVVAGKLVPVLERDQLLQLETSEALIGWLLVAVLTSFTGIPIYRKSISPKIIKVPVHQILLIENCWVKLGINRLTSQQFKTVYEL